MTIIFLLFFIALHLDMPHPGTPRARRGGGLPGWQEPHSPGPRGAGG